MELVISKLIPKIDFALDPTNKNFRKVADGEYAKEQKFKRRKLHEE
jgi:hypothetical protein